MKRYNKQLGFEKSNIEEIKEICQVFNDTDMYRKTNHVIEQMQTRFDLFEIGTFLQNITFKYEDIFEYYFENGKVTKVVFSMAYNDTENVKMVLDRNKTIITLWLNKKTDLHSTLDTSIYTKAIA